MQLIRPAGWVYAAVPTDMLLCGMPAAAYQGGVIGDWQQLVLRHMSDWMMCIQWTLP